jgi:hypothetical protein
MPLSHHGAALRGVWSARLLDVLGQRETAADEAVEVDESTHNQRGLMTKHRMAMDMA